MANQKRFVASKGLDNNNNTITNVSDPVNAQDAATKNYADTSIANEVTARNAAIATGNSTTLASAKSYTDSSIATEVTARNAAIAAGNSASSTKLATARTINGVSFDGTANITINAVDSTARVASSLLGAANGVATLDGSGLVPAAQLPSYVDDVLEFTNLASFPATGETGKIYVAKDTNKTYRWSGSAYIYITSGAVDSVAGKTGVVTLAKGDVGLVNVDNTADTAKPVSTAQAAAIASGDSTTLASANSYTDVKFANTKSTLTTFKYTATAGQTTFSGADDAGVTLSYSGSVMVTLNGVKLRPGTDFTASSGTSVVLTVAAAVGDEMLIDSFGAFDVANTYGKAVVDAKADGTNPTLNGNVTIAGGTANGVGYLNSSKVLTTGSALTFDGTTLDVQTTNSAIRAYSTGTNGAFFKATNSGGTSYIGEEGASPVFGAAYGLSLWNTASGATVFGLNNTEQMRLTSTGLGIGTSSPIGKLGVKGQSVFTASGTPTYLLGSSEAVTVFGAGASEVSIRTWQAGVASALIGHKASDQNLYITNTYAGNALGSNGLALDSSGNLGLGVTPSAWGSGYKALELPGGYALIAATGSPQGILTTNAYLSGSGWVYKQSYAATLYQTIDGAHKWYTAPSGTAGNAISFTQAMTLDASGNLYIGNTTGVARLAVTSPNPTSGYVAVLSNNQSSAGRTGTYLLFDAPNLSDWKIGIPPDVSALSFYDVVAGAERARIDSSGNWFVGSTTTSNNTFYVTQAGNYTVGHASGTASGTQYSGFLYAGTTIGSITQSGTTSVAYNTTSDHRLKTNVRPADALKFMDVEFVDFEWTDGRHDCGVIAHQLQSVYPDLVTGKKDATEVRTVEVTPAVPAVLDDNGVEISPEIPAVTQEQTVPVYQQVNYIGLIGRMGTVIQRQQRMIEAMEARLAALEAK